MPASPRTAIDPAEIEEQRRRGWPDFHPETYCHRCGRPNVASWSAPSPLWNAVMETDEEWGIVCPPCFAELAEPIVGPLAHWRFGLEAEAAQQPAPRALPARATRQELEAMTKAELTAYVDARASLAADPAWRMDIERLAQAIRDALENEFGGVLSIHYSGVLGMKLLPVANALAPAIARQYNARLAPAQARPADAALREAIEEARETWYERHNRPEWVQRHGYAMDKLGRAALAQQPTPAEDE